MANQMQTITGQRSVTKEQWLNMISSKIDEVALYLDKVRRFLPDLTAFALP